MLDRHKFLGNTKIDTDYKIIIVKNVAEILGINKGDTISFYEENGKVYIQKG